MDDSTKTKLCMFLLIIVAVAGIGVMLASTFNMGMTGNTAKTTTPGMITASGSFGGLGNGQAQLSFSANGGPATGTFSGTYSSGPAKAAYNGQLTGTYAGGDGGTVSGTMGGSGKVTAGGYTQTQQIGGRFTGTISLTKGTVIGTWNGGQSGGQFNLKFTPVKGTQPATRQTRTTPTQTATTTSSSTKLGYCRCITGPYEAGAITNYYGGKGLEFKGFTTLQSCITTCKGKHSWIQTQI